MKKASKILTLILVFVLLAGVFSSCAMFTRNTGRYRGLVAVTVGEQEITVGKILDSFNNYYNTYASYIGQGLTVDWLLQMTMQSLVTQAMKVDSYVSSNPAATDNIELKDFCNNAQYLTKEEIEFCIRYVKYLTFQSFDSSVQNILSVNRTIADEEKEDTSRDFTELDDLEGYNYSEYTYRNRVFSDTAEEYFDKYYGGMENIKLTSNADEYVFANEQAASAMLENLNGRLDKDDEKITYTEYRNAQEKVVSQYQRTIKNSYNIDFEKFMINQIEDMVSSVIVAKYDWNVNKSIDAEGEALNATINQLKENLQINTDAQATGFALNGNFVEFIQGLSSTSYIYNVPQEYLRSENDGNGYIFVKNILIPFNSQQKATLANLAKDLGDNTDRSEYIKERNKLAAQIIADDFNSEKDDDGKYATVENIFKLDEKSNELIINPNGELGNVFLSNGSVEGGVEAVIANMKRFNTDTAQHTAQYDYVVRVGEVPSDYTAPWVPEFVDAANAAAKLGVGSYALGISTYGVHIVYYTADVTAQQFDFDNNYLDTAKPEYRLFKSYFSQQSSLLLEQSLEALKKSFLEENKITTNKNFDRFLKDNGFTFDLIDFLTDED